MIDLATLQGGMKSQAVRMRSGASHESNESAPPSKTLRGKGMLHLVTERNSCKSL
ncbi:MULTISPECIES: hypothetical protein [Paraburkholderia]|uniref:hypothetical protein n=1 Tax=Paraburkholderia TaxID=1822464 RepID=UPI001551E30B|nr:hypothetical protein [Paraburkholderia phenazinium]